MRTSVAGAGLSDSEVRAIAAGGSGPYWKHIQRYDAIDVVAKKFVSGPHKILSGSLPMIDSLSTFRYLRMLDYFFGYCKQKSIAYANSLSDQERSHSDGIQSSLSTNPARDEDIAQRQASIEALQKQLEEDDKELAAQEDVYKKKKSEFDSKIAENQTKIKAAEEAIDKVDAEIDKTKAAIQAQLKASLQAENDAYAKELRDLEIANSKTKAKSLLGRYHKDSAVFKLGFELKASAQGNHIQDALHNARVGCKFSFQYKRSKPYTISVTTKLSDRGRIADKIAGNTPCRTAPVLCPVA